MPKRPSTDWSPFAPRREAVCFARICREPALLRASHLLGLALGSALGKLRDSGATVARMFEKAEEQALLLRMMRETAGILRERWDKVPEPQLERERSPLASGLAEPA